MNCAWDHAPWAASTAVLAVGMIDFWMWSIAALCAGLAVIITMHRWFRQQLDEERGWQKRHRKRHRP